MPCSVRKVVVHRMTATVNPYKIGVGKGMDIINEVGLPTVQVELHHVKC